MMPRYRFAVPDAAGLRWHLVRNCSITPRQLGVLYVSLCAVSTVIGAGFRFQGASLVAPFAVLELLAVGIAFLIYARHATDGERVLLAQGCLEVEVEQAGRVMRTVLLGRHVRPELRGPLARELASALRTSVPGA